MSLHIISNYYFNEFFNIIVEKFLFSTFYKNFYGTYEQYRRSFKSIFLIIKIYLKEIIPKKNFDNTHILVNVSIIIGKLK